MSVLDFCLFVVLVALGVKWILTLLDKWRIREWLQLHAPCDFLYKLFSCDFCMSWWIGVVISVILALLCREWVLLFVPIFSSVLR